MAMVNKEKEFAWEADHIYEDLDGIRLVRQADVSSQVRIVGWYRPDECEGDELTSHA